MNNRYIWLLSAGHLSTDLNQGALPAILPFLVMQEGFERNNVSGRTGCLDGDNLGITDQELLCYFETATAA